MMSETNKYNSDWSQADIASLFWDPEIIKVNKVIPSNVFHKTDNSWTFDQKWSYTAYV